MNFRVLRFFVIDFPRFFSVAHCAVNDPSENSHEVTALAVTGRSDKSHHQLVWTPIRPHPPHGTDRSPSHIAIQRSCADKAEGGSGQSVRFRLLHSHSLFSVCRVFWRLSIWTLRCACG